MPVDRYLSPDFAALEDERLWPSVWQIACTVDHVAEPGDYFEYRAGPYSVLIVRGDDGELRAFQNVCRHRGNSICQGSGEGLTEMRCPCHQWTWDLSGQLREVPSRKWFGGLVNDDFPLFPVQRRHVGAHRVREPRPGRAAARSTTSRASRTTPRGPTSTSSAATAVTHTMVDCNWKVVADGFSRDLPRAGPPSRDARLDGRHQHASSASGSATACRTSSTACRARASAATWRPGGVGLVRRRPRVGAWGPTRRVRRARAPPVPEGQTMLDVIAAEHP